MTDLSSPLNAPTRLLEPRILSTSSSFSSLSSASSVRHHQPLNGFSSPCSVASPVLKGGNLGDDEENDDLGSDVERSFGEAMTVVDETPAQTLGSSSVDTCDSRDPGLGSSQSRSPTRSRVSSLRRGIPKEGLTSAMMTMPTAPVFSTALNQPPLGLLAMASPTSEEDDHLSIAHELSPTAQRRPSVPGASRIMRRPAPAPIQPPSFSLTMSGSEVGVSEDQDILRSKPLSATAGSSFTTLRTASSTSTSSSSSGLVFNTRPWTFGRESSRPNLSTAGRTTLSSSQIKFGSRPGGPSSGKGLMLPPPVPNPQNNVTGGPVIGKRGSGSKIARKGLPTQWAADEMSQGGADGNPGPSWAHEAEPEPLFTVEPTDILGSAAARRPRTNADGMDVDSPYRQQSAAGSSGVTHSLSFDSPASSRRATEGSQPSGSPDFGSFFCDSPSAPQLRGTVGGLGRMNGSFSRRTSSPASPLESPSTSRPPSVASRMFEKTASTNVGGIFGGNGLSGRSMVSRRTQPYKRPVLPPLVSNSTSDVPRVMSTASALPVLENGGQTGGADLVAPGGPIVPGRRGAASMRRAYSVCDQGAQAVNHGSDPSDRESLDDSPCAGSRVVSHFEPGHPPAFQSNGSGFRTVGHSSSFNGSCVPSGVAGSPFGQGMLGFGENEKDGKLLPCHRVKEDGLVRITPETLRSVINGEYDDQIRQFHIIDCRFEYEYEGGHIDGAVNVNSDRMVEELLLQPGSGIYANGGEFPLPSRSGSPDDGKPVVIIFHCEFSNKRAPAFAKHLRSKDRTINNQHYPKVFYPELYILEGGYCDFYKNCPDKCDPSAYTRMDDPQHVHRRDSDLHAFRQFNRTRSFTYGDAQTYSRAPVPGPPLAFAPSNISNERRDSRAVIHEEEDVHMASPKPKGGLPAFDSPDMGSDASPCARVVGNAGGSGSLFNGDNRQPIFGSTKHRTLGRTIGRSTFMRVASYAGTANPSQIQP